MGEDVLVVGDDALLVGDVVLVVGDGVLDVLLGDEAREFLSMVVNSCEEGKAPPPFSWVERVACVEDVGDAREFLLMVVNSPPTRDESRLLPCSKMLLSPATIPRRM